MKWFTVLVLSAACSFAQGISLHVIEGQGAINNITRGTAYEPVVEVRDAAERPIAGASVTFTLPSIGPGGTFVDGGRTLMVQTGADGRAVARGLKPNNQVGQFDIRVTANHAGESATLTVSQTNAAPAVSTSPSRRKLAIILAVIGGGAAAAAASLAGGGSSSNGNQPTPSDPVSGSIRPGAPGFGPPQ